MRGLPLPLVNDALGSARKNAVVVAQHLGRRQRASMQTDLRSKLNRALEWIGRVWIQDLTLGICSIELLR